MRSTPFGVGLQSAQIAAISLLLAGCASQGPPQPPSLNLPQPAQNLVASRVGDHVELTWTTPGNTTDGIHIKGAITANICLGGQSDPQAKAPKKRAKHSQEIANPAACNAVQHLAAAPGAARETINLTAELSAGPPRPVAYAVELLNATGKSVGPSAPVFVAAGAAPRPTGALKISPGRGSAVIQWQPAPSSAVVELKRTLVATPAGPVSDAPGVKSAKSPAPFSPNAKQPPREVTLRADTPGKDAGGMIDTTVRDGDTYTYIAQRVQTLTLAGHPLELRSQPSPAATFTFHDVFPPKPPTGLVLVPGGGFGEPPSIDLSWDASPEPDILGYNIYRSSGADFAKRNDDPVAVPSFRDLHVEPGQRYSYRVTAIDARQNESAPGAPATETLRK